MVCIGAICRTHHGAAHLDRVRGYDTIAEYKEVTRKRKIWIEPLFGEAK